MKVRHRLAPVGNGAIRIGRFDVLKGEESLIVPERVQERDTAIEFGSHARSAADLELHNSKLYWQGTVG